MSGAALVQFDDAGARERIRTSLHECLIVEASAGTGKTTELVQRIVNVLKAGLTTIDKIVAVTFTHKAAGELKLRLRQELDRAREANTHLDAALARLEEASIGTIHGFCAQILRERPVEAGVDPAFREAAEQESDRLYRRAFRAWIQRKLNEDSPGLRRALTRLAWVDDGKAPPMERLQFAGRALIEWRDFPGDWERIAFYRQEEIDRLVAAVQNASLRMNSAIRPVHEAAQWIARAEEVRARDYDTLESLLIKLLKDLRELKRKGTEELIAELDSFKRVAESDLAAELRDEMADLVAGHEQLKRAAGQLDFLDLLEKARNLVRDNREVRQYLQARFSHIFVDEFQDTDPLQAEILLLLAADSPDCTRWLDVRPVPGKLFVVGDPKQSIYKFRRADVVLYETLKQRLAENGAGVVHLTRSFRSVRPIQHFVNAAFATEMTGNHESGQATYAPLEEYAAAIPAQPSVVALPAPYPYGTRRVSKLAINACLPDTIVAFTEWLLSRSGWKVRHPERPDELVPIEPQHVCLLFRRFVNSGEDLTRDYTRSMEARGIPHLLVGSKSFHSREEVETMRMALAAVEWPADELAVFATLRGSLFAINDALLLRYRQEAAALHPFHKPPANLAPEFEPVAQALAVLADLHRRRNWRPVAESVNLLIEAARAHAGFALRPAGHQVLANVHRIADLARRFEVQGGISFRGFVEALSSEAQKAESAEAPVVEEGAEGVRLMTVHAAKGLEFPVVILADQTANLAAYEPERYVDGLRRVCAQRLLFCSPWELIQHQQEEKLREQAEGVRVAYVASTRARDLLVVPAVGDEEREGWLGPLNKALYPDHREFRKSQRAEGCPTFGPKSVLDRPIDLLSREEPSVRPGLVRPRTGHHSVVWWDPSTLRLGVEPAAGLRQEEILAGGTGESTAQYDAWRAARQQAIDSGSTPEWRIFTASEAEAPPPGFDCDVRWELLERVPGRPSGPRFGTLVHALMAAAPLDATRHQLGELAALHGRLLGATTAEVDSAAEAALAALGHPLLVEARQATTVRRELPVVLPEAATLLEGVIDLAFEHNQTWTVVDFKTDADLQARKEHYETQVRWYAYALSRLTGKPVQAWLLSV